MICPRPKRCQAAADEDVLAGPRAGGWRETPDHHDLHAPNTVLLLRLGLGLGLGLSSATASAAFTAAVLLFLGHLIDSPHPAIGANDEQQLLIQLDRLTSSSYGSNILLTGQNFICACVP